MIRTRQSKSDFESYLDTLGFDDRHRQLRMFLIEKFDEFSRVQLVAPRQAGTSTTLAIYALHRAALEDNQTIQIVLPNWQMVRCFSSIFTSLGAQSLFVDRVRNRLLLPNGSQICVLTAENLVDQSRISHLTIVEHLSMLPEELQSAVVYELNARSCRYILAGQLLHHDDTFAKTWIESLQEKNLITSIELKHDSSIAVT
jgi:hypothetical protein